MNTKYRGKSELPTQIQHRMSSAKKKEVTQFCLERKGREGRREKKIYALF